MNTNKAKQRLANKSIQIGDSYYPSEGLPSLLESYHQWRMDKVPLCNDFKIVIPVLTGHIYEAVDNYNGCVKLGDTESAKYWSERLLEFGRAREILNDNTDPCSNRVDVDELLQSVKTQLQIIKALISSQSVRNLDESIAYYEKLIKETELKLK